MSRNSFAPVGFAEQLADSTNFAIADKHLVEWTGTHWSLMPDDDALSLALDWIKGQGNISHVTAANATTALRTAKLDLPKLTSTCTDVVVPVFNGYVHVGAHGAELLPHDKALCLRHVVRCSFDESAPKPENFMAFVERILPDVDVRARVQEYLGYTLISDARHQRAQIWIGNGANGKGVLANIIQRLHAKVASVNLDSLEGFNLAQLLDASLVYCDEAPERKLNQNLLKSLIAGEAVSINQKFKDVITKRISAKWLILTNQIPSVTDQSEGFWRRFDIVPFPVHIPESERDPNLADTIIRDELDGVLGWVLEGLVRLLARGHFDPKLPGPMEHAKTLARIQTSSVRAWVVENYVENEPGLATSKDVIYHHYQGWCRANGMSSESSIMFWKSLRAEFPCLNEFRKHTASGGYARMVDIRIPA